MKLYLLIILLSFSSLITFSQNQKKVDSLKNELKLAKYDTLKISILKQLSRANKENHPEIAIQYAEQGLNIAKKQNIMKELAELNRLLGLLYSNNGELDKSLNFLQNSLIFYNELNDIDGQSMCYNSIGIVYEDLGDYTMSMNNYLKALKIFEKQRKKTSIATCNNNIGALHLRMGNYKLAIDYFIKALKISEEMADFPTISLLYNNIGIVYDRLEKSDMAMLYYQKALEINLKLNNQKALSMNYNNIAGIYNDKKNYIQSLDYYHKALAIKIDLDEKKGIAIVLGNISEVNIEKKNYQDAIVYAEKSLFIAKINGFLEQENSAYYLLINANDSLKKPYEVIKYYKLYLQTKDSLLNTAKNVQITKMEAVYQNEKKQKDIDILEKEKALQNIEVRSQKLQKYAFIGGFVFMIILAILIFRSYRNKKKSNNLLMKKNAEIQQQKEEILSQSEELHVINDELEKLSIVAKVTESSVVIANAEGIIEWVNAGFERLFEYNLEEFKREFSPNLNTSSSNPNFPDLFLKCVENKNSVIYDSESKTKSGKNIWTQTTLTPYFDENGNIIKIIIIDSDITSLKKAELEIKNHRDQLFDMNTNLSAINRQITDSINYAKLIQMAILPSISELQNTFPESFIFFQPRDIVSGDFYWFAKHNELVFVALIDCTGHGVPGAFMSMIGNTLLNQIVNEKEIFNPSEILFNLHKGILFALSQRNDSIQEDGMEMSLCVIDTNKNELKISSTNQTVFTISGNKLNEYAGTVYSIGNKTHAISVNSFETVTISAEKDMLIYLSTDGYFDQFGGEKNKKFGLANFIELLQSVNKSNIIEQKEIIEKTFFNWKQKNKQIDDVTVIGLKLA